ncbi:hypothetical protein ZWY2020_027486 [Hordeum vulgare]|nr:hypothetical protein ZWY2020_027486 [Hordeum vulgare]
MGDQEVGVALEARRLEKNLDVRRNPTPSPPPSCTWPSSAPAPGNPCATCPRQTGVSGDHQEIYYKDLYPHANMLFGQMPQNHIQLLIGRLKDCCFADRLQHVEDLHAADDFPSMAAGSPQVLEEGTSPWVDRRRRLVAPPASHACMDRQASQHTSTESCLTALGLSTLARITGLVGKAVWLEAHAQRGCWLGRARCSERVV